MNNEVYNYMYSMISLLGIWWLLLVAYRGQVLDRFRFSVFCLRERVFDYAAKGHIAFSDPAYRMLRDSMNGFLRYGHKFTLLDIIASALFLPKNSDGETEEVMHEWESALGQLTNTQREQVERFHEELMSYVVKHILLSSPELLASIIIPVLMWIPFVAIKALGSKCVGVVAMMIRIPLESINASATLHGRYSVHQ